MKKIKSQIINYKDPVTKRFVPFSAIGNPFKKLIDFLNDIIDVERKSIFIKDENKNMTNINSQVISMRSDVNNTEVVIDAGDVFLSIKEGHISLRELNSRTNELKKSVSDGKEMLAESITNKGIDTASTDSFSVMAENISNIVTSTKNTIAITDKPTVSVGNAETIVSYEQILPMPYIQGNGSSYFDTGLMWTDTTKLEFEFKVINSNHYYEWVWGLGSNGKLLGISSRNIGNNSFRIMLGDSGENNNMTVDYVSVYHLIFDNVTKKVTVINNGAEYQINSEFVTNNTIPILCINNDNTFINACSNAFRLYSFNIYESGVPIRNYVPAKDAENIVCLYDKINDTFLYDATGANTFKYGEDFIL